MKSKGFSIIELLVVMTLLGMALGLVISSLRFAGLSGEQQKVLHLAKFIEKGWQEQVALRQGGWLHVTENNALFFAQSPLEKTCSGSKETPCSFSVPQNWRLQWREEGSATSSNRFPLFIPSDRQGVRLQIEVDMGAQKHLLRWEAGGMGIKSMEVKS